MFSPELAKQILSYRIHTAQANEYNAALFNTSGWRFGWECAYTGVDVTPACCPEVRLYQMHLNGDIAFAGRFIFFLAFSGKFYQKLNFCEQFL